LFGGSLFRYLQQRAGTFFRTHTVRVVEIDHLQARIGAVAFAVVEERLRKSEYQAG